MSKVELRTLESVTGNDAAATALLNANFEEISEALDNALSRDGTAPNYMDANLDMNNKRLINLADPENDYDAINKKYFTDTIGNAASYASQAATSAAAAASSAQSSATSAAQAIAELQAAEATIQEAAERAIEEVEGRAEAELEEYVEETVKPDLQDMINDASSYATAASGSATLAERWATSTTVVADGKYGSLYYAQQADSANTDAQSARNTAQTAASNANIWAEGTDEQVQALGGIHSSKVWSTFGKFYVGQIVESPLPITDASLHLLDGSLILGGGIYDDFVTYIAGLVSTYPACFTTEASWQQSVTNYGVCGKFVYDSVNNTVRLPKYSDKIYTTDTAVTAPVIGNGKALGLYNGSTTAMMTQSGNNTGNLNATRGLGVGTSINVENAGVSDGSYNASNDGKAIGVSPDADKSGLIASLSNITAPVEGYYYIVVATSTKTEIEVNIDEIVTDLNGKADKNLSNVSTGSFENVVAQAQASGKETVTSWGMPDYSAGVSITFPFTAPTDGLVVLVQNSGWGALNMNDSANRFVSFGWSGSGHMPVVFPIAKGDKITTANDTYYLKTFYPLKGEN